jgi:hypothetical protein
MSYVVEFFTVEADGSSSWKVRRYRHASSPEDLYVVRLESGKWSSSDPGFSAHKSQKASKRIRIVKEHVRLKQPDASAYWIDRDGSIKLYSLL